MDKKDRLSKSLTLSHEYRKIDGIVTDWATFRFLFRLRRNTRFDTLSIICSQRDDERAECYKVYHIPIFGVVCGPTSTELKTARTYA